MFSVLSIILNSVSIFYIGLAFAFSAGFLSMVLSDCVPLKLKLTYQTKYVKVIIYSVVVLSILAILFVPVYEGTMFDWSTIPLLNWCRYFASILLTTFIPGYFILSLLDNQKRFKTSILIVLSFLVSIFVTFLFNFCILLLQGSADHFYLVLLLFTLLLLILNISKDYSVPDRLQTTVSEWGLPSFLLLVSIFSVIFVGSIITMIGNLPITPGDMQVHYGIALNFSNGFPVYNDILVTYPGGYLLHLYLNALFVISGVPYGLALQGLYLLSFVVPLSFYSLADLWLENDSKKKMVLTAVFLSLLLGFGGIYLLYLLLNGSSSSLVDLINVVTVKTYDLGGRILYLPDIVAPIWVIGLPSLFALLYLIKAKCYFKLDVLLFPLIVCLCYLGHSPEVFLFSILLLIYVLFFSRGSKYGLYLILGLIFTALIDFVAPAQMYILNSATSAFSSTYFVVLTIAFIISIVEFSKSRIVILDKLAHLLKLKAVNNWTKLRWVMFYAYLFSIVVWIIVLPEYNIWTWGGVENTPFFVFALRFGGAGFMAVLTLFFLFPEIVKNKALFFFSLFIPLGLILEQLSNYYPIYISSRYSTITLIGVCIVAAYGLIAAVKKIRFSSIKKASKFILFLGLGFLIFSGAFSTSLYYAYSSNYSSSYTTINKDELAALDFIKVNTPSNASVLTFTSKSSNELSKFAGINDVQEAQRWSDLLLSSSNPYIITYVLGNSKVKYVYLTEDDFRAIDSNIMSAFFTYFSKVFYNSYATIYEVPLLTAPTSSASLGVINFPPTLSERNEWIDDTFTSEWHLNRQYGETASFTDVQNGLFQISVESKQSGSVWTSYSRSNLSLNTTIFPLLSFNYRVLNNCTYFTVQLLNSTNQIISCSWHLSSSSFNTKTLVLPENQTITSIELIVETTENSADGTIACVEIDYIRFYEPQSAWKDNASSNYLWSFYKLSGNVSDYSINAEGETKFLGVTSNQSGSVWVSYSIPLELKTSNSILNFRYKVSNDYSRMTVILQNDTSRFFFYVGNLASKELTSLSFPLPDGQTITRIEILVETTSNAPLKVQAGAQIDSLEISKPIYTKKDVLPALFVSLLQRSYTVESAEISSLRDIENNLLNYDQIFLTSDPQIEPNSLLNWLSNNKTLIVFNSKGTGFFADLLSITSSSEELSVFIYNSGKILYINLDSPNSQTELSLLGSSFIKVINSFLTNTGYDLHSSTLPVYNSIKGEMRLNGDLVVNTDTLKIQGNLKISNSSLGLGYSNIEILGNLSIVMHNSSLLVNPADESYLSIQESTYSVMSLEVTGENMHVFSDGILIYNSTESYTLMVYASNSSALAKLPSFRFFGVVEFDKLDVHSSLYVPLAGIVQQPAKIRGLVEFKILWITKPLVIFSEFQVSGKVTNLATITHSRELSWNEVLTSPYNIAFNLLFLLLISFFCAFNILRHKRVNQNFAKM